MFKFLSKLNRKKWLTITLVCLVVMFSFGVTHNSLAQETSGASSSVTKGVFRAIFPKTAAAADVASALGLGSTASCLTSPDCWISFIILTIYKILSTLLGFIILGLTVILKVVLEYDDWVNSPAVINGWGIVRDITNMFFILILLIIAISTILRIQSYNFKRLLPKVLLAALLVNFSLVIAGVLLDASQVVMNSFVRAFIGTFSESLFDSLSVKEVLFSSESTVNLTTDDGIQFTQVAANAVLGLIMLSLIAFVIGVMVIVLVARMVMLWFLLVLAPLPYLLASFPQGQRYAQQWWEEFTKYLIVGPLLAFFLWLNFVVVKASTVVTGFTDANAQAAFNNNSGVELNLGLFSGITTPQQQLSMIISIGMLMAGLMFTQKMSVAGSSAAGAVFNKAKSMGVNTLKGAGRWSVRRADDAQALAQKGIIGYGLGNTSFGRVLGLDRFQESGVKLRTLPSAIKARSEEVEKERTKTSQALAHDIVSQITPSRLTHGTSSQMQKIEDKEVAEELKDLQENGDTSNAGITAKIAEYTAKGKNGRLRGKDQAKVKALYKQLVKQDGLEELYKHNEISSLVGDDHTSNSFSNLLEKQLGDGYNDFRGQLEKIGKDNNTAITIQGGTEIDPKTKKRVAVKDQKDPITGRIISAAEVQAGRIEKMLNSKNKAKDVINPINPDSLVDKRTGNFKTDSASVVLRKQYMKAGLQDPKAISGGKRESSLNAKTVRAYVTEYNRLVASALGGNVADGLEANQIKRFYADLYRRDNVGNTNLETKSNDELWDDLDNIATSLPPHGAPNPAPGTITSRYGGKVYI